MSGTENAQRVYAALMGERPQLHGLATQKEYKSAVRDWSLAPKVLNWLTEHVRPGARTLETGCGYSTIVFALWGCRHQVVSPFPAEHQSINEWCHAHGVPVDSVEYHVGVSQRVLPAMAPTPLDLVIIDGDHAVPAPLIDYYYTADRLVKDGLLLVDDTQLRSVEQLTEFLDTEAPRWALVDHISRTRIYRKRVAGNVAEGIGWVRQPFCSDPTPRTLAGRGLRKIRRMAGRP